MTERPNLAPLYDEVRVHRHLWQRVRDLDHTPEYPVDDHEPAEVAAERVQSHVRLWEARRQWEREQRDLDALAQRIDTRDRDRLRELSERHTPTPEQQAKRATERELAERMARVRLAADQAGLQHRVDYLRLPGTPDQEAHRILAPEGHPALRRRHPWEPEHRPQHVAGLLSVDVGVTLEAVEDWFGLPHTATGRRRPHDPDTGRALDDDEQARQ
ncbi:hypothetical protein [Gordonia hongkongensis]|uniref:hypothetical protein n=1 Tax=Gordonia hongkongensis TaxID=1701090 RepID=UPI003D73FF70